MTPADFAADELERRRAEATQRVAAGKWPADVAEARLAPWLHIAAMAGAPLDQFAERSQVVFPAARAGETQMIPLVQDLTGPQRGGALLVLARARDAEVDRVTDTPPSDPAKAKAAVERARLLAKLALHLGAPPYLPPAQRPRQQPRNPA